MRPQIVTVIMMISLTTIPTIKVIIKVTITMTMTVVMMIIKTFSLSRETERRSPLHSKAHIYLLTNCFEPIPSFLNTVCPLKR